MSELQELFFINKTEWREWLEFNYDQPDPVWLIFWKKGTGKPTLSYDDAVEQALCFGWIDGVIKGINEMKFKRKFMQRTNFENWSDSNQTRVHKLIKSKEMTVIGLNKIGNYAKTGQLIWPDKEEFKSKFSENLLEMLISFPLANENFNNMAKSHQERYIGWVMSAKKEETRIRRMKEA